MKKISISIFVLLSFLSFMEAKAQDPSFTQFYANPIYLNPAFAGSNICSRISLNYRNQWPGISGNYITSSASFDKFVFKIKSGLGVLVMNDRAGLGTFSTTNISGVYSYQLRLRRNLAINFGLQATYAQKSLDWNKLTFGDMIDEKQGFINYTNEKKGLSSKSYADFSGGIICFTKRIYAGFAAHHLTQPNEGLISESKLPLKLTAHAGAIIPLNGERGNATFSPNILFQQQQNMRQLNIGVYFTKGSIVGGLWYRSNDAFILLVGFQKGIFKVGYSYDITVSKLTNASAGSHELSVGLQFSCVKPKPKYRPGICPSF